MPNAGDWINPDDYSEDCEYFDIPTGGVWKGRAAMEEMKQGMEESMSDGTDSEMLFTHHGDKVSVSWWRWHGKMTIDMGAVPAKGKPFDVQGVTVIVKDDDGKIVKQIDVWDALAQMAQFGAVPSFLELMAGSGGNVDIG